MVVALSTTHACHEAMESCRVELLAQYSSRPCHHGKTFGCHPGGESYWVFKGCRGRFSCEAPGLDYPPTRCGFMGMSAEIRTNCSCALPLATVSRSPPPPPLKLAYKLVATAARWRPPSPPRSAAGRACRPAQPEDEPSGVSKCRSRCVEHADCAQPNRAERAAASGGAGPFRFYLLEHGPFDFSNVSIALDRHLGARP